MWSRPKHTTQRLVSCCCAATTLPGSPRAGTRRHVVRAETSPDISEKTHGDLDQASTRPPPSADPWGTVLIDDTPPGPTFKD